MVFSTFALTMGSSSAFAGMPDVVRSNGRGRNQARQGDAISIDPDAPVAREFAQEDGLTRPSGSNGRGRKSGSIIEEIPTFDIADTTPEALETARPETTAAIMARYQVARQALFEAAALQEETYGVYLQIQDLGEDAVATLFPQGGYEAAISFACQTYYDARDEVALPQALSQEILMELSGGKSLSERACLLYTSPSPRDA